VITNVKAKPVKFQHEKIMAALWSLTCTAGILSLL